MPANLSCHLAGAGGSRPEIGAGTDAPLAHLDHHGHLRADCSSSADAGRYKQLSELRQRFTVHYGPISRLFEAHRNDCNCRQPVEKIGGASRARTDDLIVANDALSQLSYSPILGTSRVYRNSSSAFGPRPSAGVGELAKGVVVNAQTKTLFTKPLFSRLMTIVGCFLPPCLLR